jgi:hypothetical protein
VHWQGFAIRSPGRVEVNDLIPDSGELFVMLFLGGRRLGPREGGPRPLIGIDSGITCGSREGAAE